MARSVSSVTRLRNVAKPRRPKHPHPVARMRGLRHHALRGTLTADPVRPPRLKTVAWLTACVLRWMDARSGSGARHARCATAVYAAAAALPADVRRGCFRLERPHRLAALPAVPPIPRSRRCGGTGWRFLVVFLPAGPVGIAAARQLRRSVGIKVCALVENPGTGQCCEGFSKCRKRARTGFGKWPRRTNRGGPVHRAASFEVMAHRHPRSSTDDLLPRTVRRSGRKRTR